ncbi:CoA-binding protein [Gracilimonas sp.]|uniref:CoA-binding protein n=1 Tax=Gracilimonas sp. TaxID=1974203 RepID=UPI0032EF3169
MRKTYNDWYLKKMRADKELSKETDEVEELLDEVKTIAMVGISRNRHRDSQYVARYLKEAGYQIVPVNPGADEILGEKSYPDLASIPFPVDVVDVFRRPEDIPEVVDEALKINPKVIWLQLGTGDHPEIRKKVEEKGIQYVQKRCIKVDHQFLIRPKKETN